MSENSFYIDDDAHCNEEYYSVEEKDGIDEHHLRAENEDDDGYDPYSDRIEVEPLFEEDPWR